MNDEYKQTFGTVLIILGACLIILGLLMIYKQMQRFNTLYLEIQTL